MAQGELYLLSSVDVSIGTFGLGQTNGGNPSTFLGDANTGELAPTLLRAAVKDR